VNIRKIAAMISSCWLRSL